MARRRTSRANVAAQSAAGDVEVHITPFNATLVEELKVGQRGTSLTVSTYSGYYGKSNVSVRIRDAEGAQLIWHPKMRPASLMKALGPVVRRRPSVQPFSCGARSVGVRGYVRVLPGQTIGKIHLERRADQLDVWLTDDEMSELLDFFRNRWRSPEPRPQAA